MAKITQLQKKEFLKKKLGTNAHWAKRGLLKIFEFQTQEEQDHECTHDHNGVGFTGVDGEFLSSLAKQLLKYGKLSDKQMVHLFKKMPKYWKQILTISNEEKLNALILEG